MKADLEDSRLCEKTRRIEVDDPFPGSKVEKILEPINQIENKKGYLAQRFKTPPWLSNLQIAFANHLSLLFQCTTSKRAKMCKSLVIATIR
jgi:hypothetical protein